MGGKWLAIGAAALIFGLVAGVLSLRIRHPVATAPKTATNALEKDIALVGIIRPQHIVPVPVTIAGPVTALPVEAGQDVYQGEVLARVGAGGAESAREGAREAVEQAQHEESATEAREIAARLENSRAAAAADRAQADLERARKVYERQKMLNDAGATPRLVFEKAAQDLQACGQAETAARQAVSAAAEEAEAAQTALAEARKALADRTSEGASAELAFTAAEVKAPADGVLLAVHAELGKTWEGDGAMFEIATDPAELEVEVTAPAEVLRRVRPGLAVVVADGSGAGEPGAVREIQDGRAIVVFHNTLETLKAGAQASVRLKVE